MVLRIPPAIVALFNLFLINNNLKRRTSSYDSSKVCYMQAPISVCVPGQKRTLHHSFRDRGGRCYYIINKHKQFGSIIVHCKPPPPII